MRNLVCSLIAGAALAGCASTPAPVQRPSAASGGYRAPQPKADRWVSLGAAVPTSPTQHTIEVGGAGGKIGTLMLKGIAGEAEVEQITITYMDEMQQSVDVQKKLLPGDAQVIELREDRVISRIIVIMDPDSNGQIELLGA